MWCALDSNWRLNVGMNRACWETPGHANVMATIKGLGIRKRYRSRVFNEFCAMEQAALALLNSPDQ